MKDTKFKMIVTFEKQSMESGQDASLEPGKESIKNALSTHAVRAQIFSSKGQIASLEPKSS